MDLKKKNFHSMLYFTLIFRLEFMIAKIKQDMDQLDKQLSQAESTVETTTPAAFKSIVMPFIFVSYF